MAPVLAEVKGQFAMKRKAAGTGRVKAGRTIERDGKTGRYADEPLLLAIDIDPEPIEERLTHGPARRC